MVVIYAEKHSLSKTIAAALGAGKRIPYPGEEKYAHWDFSFCGEEAVIVHGSGHLAELAKAKDYDVKYEKWDLEVYPIIPDDFKITPSKSTKPLFDHVAEYFKKADWIINATDPDREGELIFAYVMETTKCKKPWKRVILSDLTENTILKAFQNLKDSNDMLPLQYAGRARGIADWLYGINLTVVTSKKFGSPKNLLSVGRVQTATLNMIVEREKAATSHQKTLFWKVVCEIENVNFEHTTGKFEKKEEAQKIYNKVCGKNAKITKKTEKTVKEQPPLLYNSTALQAAASSLFGYTLDEIVTIMQKLYECGFITYPRTNAEHLPEEMKDEVANIIDELFKLPEYNKEGIFLPKDKRSAFTKRHFDDEKVTSHTAIIPTLKIPKNNSDFGTEYKDDKDFPLKCLKIYHLVAKSLLNLAFPAAQYCETEIETVCEDEVFKGKTKALTVKSFKVISSSAEKLSEKEKNFTCNENDTLSPEFKITEGETKPPKRYTEATLISAMETAGQTFENEELRQLMKAQKKGLGTDATRAATIKGLFEKGYIERKGKSIIPTEKGIFLIETLTIESLKNPETTGQWEKKLSDIAESDLKTSEELYYNFIKETKVNVREFYHQIKNLEGKPFLTKEEEKFVCPICKRRMFDGKFGYSCSGYKEGCKFQINYEICGKKISKSLAQMICMSGRTGIIKGFKSTKGTEFNAALLVDKENKKVAFQFEKKT